MNPLKKLAPQLRRRYPKSIRGKLVVLTIGLLLAFIWALVYVSVTVLQDRFDGILLEQQFAATQQLAATLDNKLEERMKVLDRSAQLLPVDLSSRTVDDFLARQAIPQVIFSAGMMVIGIDGTVVADYPPQPGLRGASFADRHSFQQVLATGKPHIDRPVWDPILKHPVLFLAAPVFDGAGNIRAVIAGISNLASAHFLGNVTDRAMAGPGKMLVFSLHDRVVVAATDSHQVLAPIPPRGANDIFDQAEDGFEGSGFGIASDGVPMLYSIKQVPSADWVVMVGLPTVIARRPVEVMQWVLYAAGVAVTLLGVSVLWWMTRRILAPLENTGKTLRQMTAGDIPLAPLPVSSSDEVGQLIDDFNSLLSERQRYEAALSDSEQRFRLLVESSPDAIFVQTHGCFSYVNQAAVRLFGAESKEAILGTPCIGRLHPDCRAEVSERIRRANTLGENSPPLEERYIRLDGAEIAVEVSAVPFRYQGENGALVFVRDISERKGNEEKLRALNRDFVTLLESTSDFIYFKDQDSRFRFCSQTLARITGHAHWRDMLGKHDLEVFPPDTARIYYEEELPIFREGIALLDRVDPFYDEDGNPGWVSTNKWPVFGEDGTTVVGIFGISRIVTERVEAEARLKAANGELQAFTYAASHDIRAPLGRINNFGALLERDYRDRLEGDGLLFLDLIRRNTRRLMTLVDDLLAHAEIEQKILGLQAVDLRDTVACVAREYEEEIRHGGVALHLDVPEARVLAHPHGLAQVLRNLLENALKYSSPVEAPAVRIGGSVQGGVCRLWVQDNGIGFDMAYRDRIFEVFRRLHTYEEFPGSGIGLALVKKAMERMNGSVWAESEPGRGATFHIELAVADTPVADGAHMSPT